MIPIAKPIIGEEEKLEVLEVLESGRLAQGTKVCEFESQFAAWCGVEHAVAVSSGTAALHIALLAHGIGSRDEVITSPFSFIASANCILYVGARPVFADIEPDFFTIDPVEIRQQITNQTRVIIVVHLYGQPCDMQAIAALAEEHDLVIIEDACQAHGARLDDCMVGSFGTACYSFYSSKNMTTAEGGMITTHDTEVAERARMIRDHGALQRNVHEILGFNLRMTEMQAALGLVQLPKLEAWNDRRGANATFLTEHLGDLPGLSTPQIRPGARHVFHQYTIRLQNRDAVASEMRNRGVEVGVYYPIPIYKQPLYRKLGFTEELACVEAASREVLSLPVHPALNEDDLETIVHELATLHSNTPMLQFVRAK
jgi:dTDP-4-amino-4,6-dideoxygalactose transaminase